MQPISKKDPESVRRVKAAAELVRRKRATTSLFTFGMSIDIPTVVGEAPEPDETICPAEYLYAAHHRLLIGAIQRTITRPFGRLLAMAPPGSAKSTYASVVLPPFVMAQRPKFKFILTSYASELAWKQSKRAIQIVEQEKYKQLAWPYDNALDFRTSAAANWELTNGSECVAAGLRAGITGNRADGWVIDDPVAGQQEADSESDRRSVWDAYKGDLLTRVKPEAWGILIMCQTGDTRVSMADRTERELRDIRPGDLVATHDNGSVSSSKVLNWINQGPDDVFEITLANGAHTKANARHPFLTYRNGTPAWRRLKDLREGDHCVSRTSAQNSQSAKADACLTTISGGGPTASAHPVPMPVLGGLHESNTATDSPKRIMRLWRKLSSAFAQCANNLRARILGLTGAESFASITTTQPAECAACCATIATSLSDTGKLLPSFELQQIISVTPAGREDVFDIQVERTENFIADGFVSHNTRWHEDDLAGRILPDDYKGQSGMITGKDGLEWEVLNIPAKAEHPDDPLGRQPGEYLWPEYFPPKHWHMFENATGINSQRVWSSLYQQRPTPQGAGLFTKEMFNWYNKDELPTRLARTGAGDYAVTKNGGDFTELGVVGLDENSNMWFLDWWYAQETSDVWVEQTLDMAIAHGASTWFNEGGVIDKSTRPTFNKRMRERQKERQNTRQFINIISLPSMQDKVAKMQAFRARAAAGTVWLPSGQPWAHRLVEQLCSFPAGRHDDAADVCGLLGRAIDQLPLGAAAPSERPRGIVPFSIEWLEYEEKPETTLRYR